MRSLLLALLAVVAPLSLSSAQTQQSGYSPEELQKGHQLAGLICSTCHVAGPGQAYAPVLQPPGPSFESIARRPDTNAETLRSFLTATHRLRMDAIGMPNPELSDAQLKSVVAYILSLRTAAQSTTDRKPSPPPTGSCRAEIARVELLLQQAREKGEPFVSEPESSAALLHRQPTVRSVEQAASESQKTAETAIALAKKLQSEGMETECVAMLKKFEQSTTY